MLQRKGNTYFLSVCAVRVASAEHGCSAVLAGRSDKESFSRDNGLSSLERNTHTHAHAHRHAR